jgi:O-6-methylguanine DNA methyltransferase
MVAMASGKGLAVLEFVKPDRNQLMQKRLKRWFAGYKTVDGADDNGFIDAANEWLRRYFSGEFEGLEVPALDLRGTDFELRVWDFLLTIPLGEIATYGSMSKELGLSNGARAVGGANRRNPVSLIVPCHRVIGHNGVLTGYGGGLDVKEALLKHEGAIDKKAI